MRNDSIDSRKGIDNESVRMELKTLKAMVVDLDFLSIRILSVRGEDQ